MGLQKRIYAFGKRTRKLSRFEKAVIIIVCIAIFVVVWLIAFTDAGNNFVNSLDI